LCCAEAADGDPAVPLLHHLVQGRLRALGSAGAGHFPTIPRSIAYRSFNDDGSYLDVKLSVKLLS